MNASQTEPAVTASPIASEVPSKQLEAPQQQAARFATQFSAGMLAGFRHYLARTREARDWQDRISMLDLVVATIPLDVLETACAIEPDAADLAVVRCAYYSAQTLEYRCHNLEEVTSVSVRKAGDCIRAAMSSLELASRLDPADPTAFACIMTALGIFPQLKPVMQHAFRQATAVAPELSTFLVERQHPSASPSLPN